MINKTIQPKSTKSTKTDNTEDEETWQLDHPLLGEELPLDVPKIYTKNGNLAADGTVRTVPLKLSNEEQTYLNHKNSLLKPFDKEELNIIENRSTAARLHNVRRKTPTRCLEDVYGPLAPTDDDIDEELNLMGTYL